MTVRFRTRAFLVCFIPFALLLTAAFAMIQTFVQSNVREGLRASLRQNELAIARLHSKSELQNSRFLKVVGENAALKSGMQLLVSESRSENAQRTVEDQLRELGEHMGFDLLLVSAPDGAPLVAVIRTPGPAGELVPVDPRTIKVNDDGLLLINGRTLQVASIPVDQAQENMGTLSIGAYFDFSEFTTSAVLIHDGAVIASNIGDIPLPEINQSLQACTGLDECDLRMRGANWISLPMQSDATGNGYLLRSLVNVDAATSPLQSVLHNLFLAVALGSVLVALLCSLISSRSIEKPIAAVIAHLRKSAGTGVLSQFEDTLSPILEIRELVQNYNYAAISVQEARERLNDAYVEFVGSLANALDARDRYTAGHSKRVSDLSCATATAMRLDPQDIERLRVGALLHDIGKIGIADCVLQKTGRLTDEEFSVVKEHPVIGRHILEGVQGLAPFIPAVELHHENWDGTGYPRGQTGEATPVEARIIHVSDAYDAMTTDRSYRSGLTHERAIEILREYAGTQFDPHIVEVFTQLPRDLVLADQSTHQPPDEFAEFEAWEHI